MMARRQFRIQAIVWCVAAFALVIIGIAQVGHRLLGIGWYRHVTQGYVMRADTEGNGPLSSKGLSMTVDFMERGRDEEMGILMKRISTGGPYSIWITFDSPQTARWARLERAVLRFEDGSERDLEMVPFKSQQVHAMEPFTMLGAASPETSASFRAERLLESRAENPIGCQVEYTIEMTNGERIHGTTEVTLDYERGELTQFLLPSD